MAKAWILNSEREINEETHYKSFEICDRHIEVEHTQGFMRYVWIIGGLICFGAMHSTGGYKGLIIGTLGLGVIWLINRAVTTKMERDLHLIFYTERDKKHDDFFAIDIKSNEILYIQHIFPDPNDESPVTVYVFEPVSLEIFKNFIENKSERFYELVKDITPDNINLLKNIQFGETKWRWVWFVKKSEEGKTILGCFRTDTSGHAYVTYAEMSEEYYIKCYGKNSRTLEIYSAFMNEKCGTFKEGNIKFFSKELTPNEIQKFVAVLGGDSGKCNVQIEKYFTRDFIVEYEHEGNATVVDINVLNLLKYLSEGNDPESFAPTIFSDDQILNENTEEKKTESAGE